MSHLNDPEVVAREYASDKGLQGRRNAYSFSEGPDAPALAFAAVAEVSPARVLEVGCGPGEVAARIASELGSEVVALDLSEHMVTLARERGVDARVGDVQYLPFEDQVFDCVLAAWMLYHVPDVDRAIAEIARVLKPGGRLVAVTNGREHLRELRDILGAFPPGNLTDGFADELLSRHFVGVECRDASGWINFPNRKEVENYVEASRTLWERDLPESFDGPLRVRRAPLIFVAEKAA